jgi:transposase InsO family protein
VASSCLRCRIRKSLPRSPATGDLPPERLAHNNRPFTCVGLDFFGPVLVSVGRRSEKRYVALFTCLTVRAVHIEVVGSLSTDAAIMALRRFIARQGTTTLYSDNGTAFVGASRELARLYEQPVQEFAANERIAWKLIPPSAPFMAGCWERLVSVV